MYPQIRHFCEAFEKPQAILSEKTLAERNETIKVSSKGNNRTGESST